MNILDPSKHKKEVSGKKYEVAENQIALPLETIAESVEIEGKEKGTDFEVFYNDTACIVEFVEDTTGEMTVSCTEVDPSKVTVCCFFVSIPCVISAIFYSSFLSFAAIAETMSV